MACYFAAIFNRLFDTGYVTVTPALNFEVSPRIRENSKTAGITMPFTESALHTCAAHGIP